MGKKQNKNRKKVVDKNKKKKNEKDKDKNENPIFLPYNKITSIKSSHQQTLNFCFISKTNNYIITCSSTCILLLDKNTFKELTKYNMTRVPQNLIELSDNRILCVNRVEIFIFEVNNNKLNLLYYYEEQNYEEMGLIGAGEIKNGNILVIIPTCIKYYKKSKDKILELYDLFKFEDIFEILYCDYGTQFKNAFIINNNNDYIALLTSQELNIINHQKKNLVKKINIENTRVLLKYLNLTNENTLIYHTKKMLLFNNKNLEVINNFLLDKEKEITYIEKLKTNNLLAYGTNVGKIFIYDYLQAKNIREISFDNQIFKIFWIKELDNNLIVNYLPKSKISFTDYTTGIKYGELNLINSLNYRRGVYLDESKKLLLGCAKSFVLIE